MKNPTTSLLPMSLATSLVTFMTPLPLRSWRTPLLLAALCASTTGCSLIQPVQPWEKGILARPEMTIEGNDALGVKFSEHIYASRESASGGAGVGGGGCGCN
jgi:hypothetical protein